mmetsp:Transcript_4369/g.12025  ORF Transcript_4369/g.12025 Transcript_4369/m.12025 type:complete len:102 (+) Transcript_4369:401-706(+)
MEDVKDACGLDLELCRGDSVEQPLPAICEPHAARSGIDIVLLLLRKDTEETVVPAEPPAFRAETGADTMVGVDACGTAGQCGFAAPTLVAEVATTAAGIAV